MYKILEARTVGLNIKQFVIEAPRIARKQKPGQFIILRLHDKGERIPLTIKSSNPDAGTITIAVQSIGKTTSMLNSLETGDSILDIVGPLGHPSEIRNYGTAIILAGSVGTAMFTLKSRQAKMRVKANCSLRHRKSVASSFRWEISSAPRRTPSR